MVERGENVSANPTAVTILLLAFIAVRAFLSVGLVIALAGLFTRDRLVSALALVCVLTGFSAAIFVPALIDPTLLGFDSMPARTATALPFYLAFVVLALRIRQNPTLRWAFRIPVFAGGAGFGLLALYLVIA